MVATRKGFTTTMYVPPNIQMTSISMGGVTLDVPPDGIIEVPTASVKELKAHGLSEKPIPARLRQPPPKPVVEDEDEEEAPPKKKRLKLGGKAA